jgi:hypothetical protein
MEQRHLQAIHWRMPRDPPPPPRHSLTSSFPLLSTLVPFAVLGAVLLLARPRFLLLLASCSLSARGVRRSSQAPATRVRRVRC